MQKRFTFLNFSQTIGRAHGGKRLPGNSINLGFCSHHKSISKQQNPTIFNNKENNRNLLSQSYE
jgi:hypothetical protein